MVDTLSPSSRRCDLADMEGLSACIFEAPQTAFDLKRKEQLPGPHSKSITYLVKHVSGQPWADALTLWVLIVSAQNVAPSGTYTNLGLLSKRLKLFFSRSKYLPRRLTTMADFDPDEVFPVYASGLIGQDSDRTRADFLCRYQSTALKMHQWHQALPFHLKSTYKPLLLPIANLPSTKVHLAQKNLDAQTRQRRRENVDVVMPAYSDLRSAAHQRTNELQRLLAVYRDNIHLAGRSFQKIPPTVIYEEHGRTIHLRLWTWPAFVARNSHKFSEKVVGLAREAALDNEYGQPFIEVLRDEDQAEPPFWFYELAEAGLIGASRSPTSYSARCLLKDWGYPETAFTTTHAGLLCLDKPTLPPGLTASQLAKAAEGALIDPESMYLSALFGLLALNVVTTTGARMTEILQIALDRGSLVRLNLRVPSGKQRTAVKERYILRVTPKGAAPDEKADYFIGDDTKKLLYRVVKALAENYELPMGQALPTVSFSTYSSRFSDFPPKRYIFQLQGRHLSPGTLQACLRFITHGCAGRAIDGSAVNITAHLLRHVFATHAVQVAKIPVDIVAEFLHQKNVDVTKYYSGPTRSMVAQSADEYLSGVALGVDVGETLARSPTELQELYQEAQGKAGTLSEVIGGVCVSHGYCQTKFECIGCAGKVPDPAKRSQVIRKLEWAKSEVGYASAEGLLPEAARMRRLVQDCKLELREMDLMEECQADEHNDQPPINIVYRQ